jgi:hypothetical protein
LLSQVSTIRREFRLPERLDFKAEIIPDAEKTPDPVQIIYELTKYIDSVLDDSGFKDDRPIEVRLQSFSFDGYRGALEVGHSDGGALSIGLEVTLSPREAFLTLAHEMLHLQQYRWDARQGGVVNDELIAKGYMRSKPRGDLREGTARALEEILIAGSGRLQRDAAKWFTLSGHALLTPAIEPFPPRRALYSNGIFFKYLAEQADFNSGELNNERAQISALRPFCELTDGRDLDQWRGAYLKLGRFGSFDRFAYLDPDSAVVVSDETGWGNFLVALIMNNTAERDARFRFRQTHVSVPAPGRLVVPTGNVIPFASLPAHRGSLYNAGGGGSRPTPGQPEGPQPAASRSVGSGMSVAARAEPTGRLGELEAASGYALAIASHQASGSARGESRCGALKTVALPSTWSGIGWTHAPGSQLELRPALRFDEVFSQGYLVDTPDGQRRQRPSQPPRHALAPYSFMVWKLSLVPGQMGRMLRIDFRSTHGLDDALVQIVLTGPDGRLIDLIRCETSADHPSIDRIVGCRNASEIFVIVAAREKSGDFRLRLSRVVERALLFAAPWNALPGTSFAADQAARAWSWRSPDLNFDAGAISFRLYNHGDREARNVRIRLWKRAYDLKTGVLDDRWHEIRDPANEQYADACGRLKPIDIPSAAECAQREIFAWQSRIECKNESVLEQRQVSLDFGGEDPRRFLVRATVACDNNADPRGLEIVASPGGFPPLCASSVWIGAAPRERRDV